MTTIPELSPRNTARLSLAMGTAVRLLEASHHGDHTTVSRILANADTTPLISALAGAWLALAKETRTDPVKTLATMRSRLPDQDAALLVLLNHHGQDCS